MVLSVDECDQLSSDFGPCGNFLVGRTCLLHQPANQGNPDQEDVAAPPVKGDRLVRPHA